MANDPIFNIYCDESCHIEHDHVPVMLWGALVCDADDTRELADDIRALKAKHGLSSAFEIKWTKVSPAKAGFYHDAIRFFLDDDRLRFRVLLLPDKAALDHKRFGQTHDEWYYKMYFLMLKYLIVPEGRYHIYLDVKDTQGGAKTRHLQHILAHRFHDRNFEHIARVQQIRSHESEILQLADLLIGCVGYANRKLDTSRAKTNLVTSLGEAIGPHRLTETSSFWAKKFNLLVWTPSESASD